MKLTKEEALEKIEELKEYVEGIDEECLSTIEEIRKYPERFERLKTDSDGCLVWGEFNGFSDLSKSEIIVDDWNHTPLDDRVFVICFGGYYKEIIRRKDE